MRQNRTLDVAEMKNKVEQNKERKVALKFVDDGAEYAESCNACVFLQDEMCLLWDHQASVLFNCTNGHWVKDESN